MQRRNTGRRCQASRSVSPLTLETRQDSREEAQTRDHVPQDSACGLQDLLFHQPRDLSGPRSGRHRLLRPVAEEKVAGDGQHHAYPPGKEGYYVNDVINSYSATALHTNSFCR
jgi:hypothetical protein